MKTLKAILILLVILSVFFLFDSGVLAFMCWCFDKVFSWKAALGVWVIETIVSIWFLVSRNEVK